MRDPWSRTELYWKPLGKTPLEAAEAFRQRGVWVYGRRLPIPADVPIAYAGRLDPMAEGLLLFLVGEKCKELKRYTSFNKTYVVEVLLGVSTDTGDLLGLVTKESRVESLEPRFERIPSNAGPVSALDSSLYVQKILDKFLGVHYWEYPVFSSKTVQGKPLFRWFYEGKIGEIEIPKKEITIYNLQLKDTRAITQTELLEQVKTRIKKVTKVEDASKDWGNDFRRDAVLAKWEDVLNNRSLAPMKDFTILQIECKCSSGTYMRTLAEKIGEQLGVPACAFSITRTQIG